MNYRKLSTLTATVALVVTAHAQKGAMPVAESKPAPAPLPPRVWVDPNYRNPFATVPAQPAQPGQVYVYDQRPVAGPQPLVTQDQAQTIINRFRDAYPKLGNPRFLIYVNRELVDESSGLKLTQRQERIQSSRSNGTNSGSTVTSTGENTYRTDGKAPPSLADKQTVRDVERLFGRSLRAAGASLVDQKVASQLIADRPLEDFIGSTDTPQARKDREALSKIADAVIEVLISSKTVTVPTISGSQTITIPDIQATAISLKDSKILAQASSADVTNRVPPANLGNFGVNEVTEATALELMEDMTPQ